MSKSVPIYILADGDRIRERVESSLLGGDLDALAELSRSLVEALAWLAQELASTFGGKVVMAGGDDLLLVLERASYSREVLEKMAIEYRQLTGSSISFGVGCTIEKAYVNLRRAKAKGGGWVIEHLEEG